MDTSKNMSAFPVFDSNRAGMDYQCMEAGMALRDYFAAKAMQAFLSNTETLERMSNTASENLIPPEFAVATAAYALADQMLKARSF